MMNVINPSYPTPNPMAPRPFTSITDLIVHHSAGSPDQTVLEIDTEHRARGMAMIGYNYVIAKDGQVYSGRPAQFVPAAAYGRNTESLNVCVLGNFEKADPGYTGPPTPQQLQALHDLAVFLHHRFPTIVRTIGHRDVAPMFYPNEEEQYSTACPGSELYCSLPSIKAKIAAHLGNV